MIVKTAIGFLTRDAAPAVATQVDIILDAMNVAKASYPSPSPTLEVVGTANAALWVAINEAAGGGREKSAIKRARLAELVSLIRQLAAYVTATANGDMAKLLSSGFPIQKPNRARIGELPTPATPKVTHGMLSGQADAVTPPVYGASSYNWRASKASAPNVYQVTLQTTSSRAKLDGFIPGELYNVEVNAVGAAGVSNWSVAGQLRAI